MYVITFYSFKGGVGRTMALVNVAAQLARRGRKVLVVDFDLEAPGLETYKYLQPPEPHWGIVEFVTHYKQTHRPPQVTDYIYEPEAIQKKLSTNGGRLWVMPAGCRDPDYHRELADLDWKNLYAKQDGFLLFEDAKLGWEESLKPDYVLIDSRTGDTDVLGICTRQLPNAVVLMFTPNEQNLAGLEKVCRDICREKDEGLEKKIKLHFVASNVPDLDDQSRILTQQLGHFKERLKFVELSATIWRRESMRLLAQSIVIIENRKGKLAKSYRHLAKTLIAENPKDRDGAFVLLGRLENSYKAKATNDGDRGKDRPDRKNLGKVIEHFLDDPEVLLKAAQFRVLESNFRAAVRLLDRVLRIEPDFPEAILERALCHIRCGDSGSAINDLLHYISLSASTEIGILRAFRELHAIAPDRLVEASELLPADLREDTFVILEICDLLPDCPGGIERAYALAGGWSCQHLIRARLWTDAIDWLEKRLEESPFDSAQNRYDLAMAKWGETGVLSEELCSRTIQANKDDRSADLWWGAGFMEAMLHWGAGEPEEALKKIDEEIEKTRDQRFTARSFSKYHTYSPWRYRYVTEDEYLDDCESLRRMIQAKPPEHLRPAFLGPQELTKGNVI